MAGERVGVLIISFRSRRDLPACLERLGDGWTIAVVDNASDDGSVEWLRQHAPEVRLLALDWNLGFAAAINRGMALLEDCDFVLWLNPDARIDGESIRQLAAFLNAHADVAAVGPRIVRDGAVEPSLLEAPRAWRTMLYLLSGLRWHAIGGMTGRPAPGHPWERAACADHLRGSCMLVRCQAWQDVGPMDERFFLYFEETDWCLRARRRGWRICLEPRARAEHRGKGSVRTVEQGVPLEYFRSAVLFWRKVHPRAAPILRAALWIVAQIKRALLALAGAPAERRAWLRELAAIARDPFRFPLRYPRARRPGAWG